MENNPYGDCAICGDAANGSNYGVISCSGCKGFFRRTVLLQQKYYCRGQKNCAINKTSRNSCRYCRLRKCIAEGMRSEALKPSSKSSNSQQQEATIESAKFQPPIMHVDQNNPEEDVVIPSPIIEEEDTGLSVPIPYSQAEIDQTFEICAQLPSNINQHNYNVIISALARKEKILERITQSLIDEQSTKGPFSTSSSERSDSFSEEGLILAMPQDLSDLCRAQASALVRYFKVKGLTTAEQLKFFGKNTAEYLLLSCAYRSLKVRDILLLCDGMHYLPRNPPGMPHVCRIVVRILDELVAEMRHYQISEAEFYVMRCMMFISPAVYGTSMEHIRQLYRHVLEYYERENHQKEIGRTTGLMLLLPKVKSIANEIRQCAQLSSTFGVVELGPILEEVLNSDTTTAQVTAELIGMTLTTGSSNDQSAPAQMITTAAALPPTEALPELLEDIGDWIACVP